MSFSGDQPVQRSAYFALIDEADSVLIDEARTPLIISALPGEAEDVAIACYEWASATVDQFEEDEHYEYDHEKKKVELDIDGRQLVRSLPKPDLMNSVGLVDIYEYIERAIKVEREFDLDRHYVIHDDEIVIVDEATEKKDRRGATLEAKLIPGAKRMVAMVGNNLSRDIRGANELELISIYMSWSSRRSKVPANKLETPDYTIGKPDELLPLLGKLDEKSAAEA